MVFLHDFYAVKVGRFVQMLQKLISLGGQSLAKLWWGKILERMSLSVLPLLLIQFIYCWDLKIVEFILFDFSTVI